MDNKVRIKNNYSKIMKKFKTLQRIKCSKSGNLETVNILYDPTIDAAKEHAQYYKFYELPTFKVKIIVD